MEEVYAAWNVRGISYKEEELDYELQRNNVKIADITENKKKLQETKDTKNCSVIYSGVKQHVRAQSGVMIWVHESIAKTTDYYNYWNDRIIEARFRINRGYLTILGLYAPEEGRQELSDEFYEQLQNILEKTNKNDYILMMGDLNARIGNITIMKIVGTDGEPTVNNNGKKLMDFCTFNNMRIMNSFFKHKDIHKFTWQTRGSKSVIDYSIANEKAAKLFKDVRVYREAELDTDHFLLCAKLRFPP
jgi:exonuclease III